QFEIIVDERCFKTIEELDNYTWKKDKNTGEYYNEPVDTYNHCIDAIRYSV
ncbi:terminase large subunit, partial [Staphylococcus aureus]